MIGHHRRLLEVCDLCVEFHTDQGCVRAVDRVSWSVEPARTLAIVGESGCGKSVTALSVLRLIPEPPAHIVGGRITLFDQPGRDAIELTTADEATLASVRGRRISIVFQDAMTALNPVLTIGRQIVEVLELHCGLRGRAAWQSAVEALRGVGIPAAGERARDYPHQLSGGMRQRAMIAMALACRPSLLIADEPTTALDVTIQAQILDLMRQLQADLDMAILLITHDLGVVAEMASEVAVMYCGRIVEHAPTAAIYSDPLHPYTQALLRSIPGRGTDRKSRLHVITGSVPEPFERVPGCPFHPRCELAEAGMCDVGEAPPLIEARPGHCVACHRVEETHHRDAEDTEKTRREEKGAE